MSEVRTRHNSTLMDLNEKLNPSVQVGDIVRNFYSNKDIGVVIEKVDEASSRVLWSTFYDPYGSHIGEPGVFTLPGNLNFVQINLCGERKR